MSRVTVNKVPSVKDRSLPVFEEFEALAKRIRKRAYELFCARGYDDGRDLDDWLMAERELCWPTAELDEGEEAFELKVAMAGFDPDDLEVTATPREIIVKGSHESRHGDDEKGKHKRKDKDKGDDTVVHWTEFRSENVYRRVALPSAIDIDRVEAHFKHGMLEIEAPKAKQAEAKGKRDVTVSTAA